jgi:hypothetical protein
MLHARRDYQRIQDPSGKIPNEEPVFLLRGQDACAQETMQAWTIAAKRRNVSQEMIDAVQVHIGKVYAWQADHKIKVPDLPKTEQGVINGGNTDAHAMKVHFIAMACHRANKAWCESVGDYSQKDWRWAENWQRDSAIKGVEFRLNNPDAKEDSQHNAWMEDKVNDGWVYGEVKDAEKKTHPCIVPFSELPEFQQKKDKLFCGIVDALK